MSDTSFEEFLLDFLLDITKDFLSLAGMASRTGEKLNHKLGIGIIIIIIS